MKRDKFSTMLDTIKIKSLRESRGLTQEQAAAAADIGTRQSWHNIESGSQSNITLATLNSIATALGVKAKDLLK